ncbi:zincin-like metallopeptidase domain-containing protein [Marinifilum flexuosum]|uniref:Antirestriction protein ArdC n=1 Tax=Marinifilum flexuosum TaxID=1117708 RepID=A0A419X9J7_9BACT|nr:zincin-like metallopeptidase domain-containing protein [Marinifilum flexuosum]RKE04447.1 antirestriction protein ArdC [Marinifilum flexuosum]
MLGYILKSTSKQAVKKRVSRIKLRTSEILKGLFDSNLDGWKDDKEKFKLELINDIKTFLFTKWEKPWKAGLVFSESGIVLSGFRNVSGRLYKNSTNILTMERNAGKSPYFITMAALKEKGGKLIDKSKVISVLSYIPMFKDKEDKTPRKPDWMLPKLHRAVNIDYCEGIKKPVFKQVFFKDNEFNQYVENFLKELVKRKRVPKIHTDQADRCYYTHSALNFNNESIHMVNIKQFKKVAEYYSTLFHEITHSTMNPKRLGRGKLGISATLDYPNEELVAEMGAMIICTELGLKYNRQNGITYLKGWLSRAKGDVDKNLVEAYGYACDAADYLLEGIDLSKLVPKSMTNRAKEEKDKKKVKKERPKTVSNKKQEAKQLTLLGHTNEKMITNLANWKPNSNITALKGQLGKFIGGYEKDRFAIVLRGEKGAGKTRLLCQLIDLFADQNLKSLFLSLEVSPQSELFGNYISYIEKQNLKNVSVSGQCNMKQLEAYCKSFDVIAIDSWGKLQDLLSQEDFGKLIEKYPNVIWLVIFQSTTAGTARGGVMSEYDSSIVIQVAKGGNAQCEKNRYNSCDQTYNVFTKKILSNENK